MSSKFTNKPLLVLTIFTIALSALSTINLNTFAQTEKDVPDAKLDSETTEVIQNIEEVDTQNPDKVDLKIKDGEIVSEQGDLINKFDLEEKTISLENEEDGLDIQIEIPNPEEVDEIILDNDQIIFSNKDEDYDTVVENIDGGVRQIINIESREAPSEYEFKMELEVGDFLEKQEDGSAVVKNLDGEIKTTIFKPWAKDANGTELETYYEINGSTLIQKINLESKDIVFPVVADPIWCGNAIRSVSWITRNGVRSLSIRPTWCGAWGSSANIYQTVQSWREVLNKTPWHTRRWNSSTYASMWYQYACHVYYAKYKLTWNLEPSRPNVGYWGTVRRGCNP